MFSSHQLSPLSWRKANGPLFGLLAVAIVLMLVGVASTVGLIVSGHRKSGIDASESVVWEAGSPFAQARDAKRQRRPISVQQADQLRHFQLVAFVSSILTTVFLVVAVCSCFYGTMRYGMTVKKNE
jgi:hypothetical protein